MTNQIQLHGKASGLRCALCHEPAARLEQVCPCCSVAVHAACADEFPACPTLGCEHEFAREAKGGRGRILVPILLVVVGFALMTTEPRGAGVVLASVGALAIAAFNFQGLPSSPSHFLSLGRVYALRLNTVRALECFDRGLEVDPDDVDCLAAKGEALLQLDRVREAVACFDRVLEQVPDDVETLIARAQAWRQLFDDRRADADYARAEDLLLARLEEDESNSGDWELLGAARWDRDPAGALAANEAGLRVALDATSLSVQRGHFLFLAGALEEAEQTLSGALEELSEPDSWTALLRAQVRAQLGDFAGALADVKLAVTPPTAWSRLAGAMVYAVCGEVSAAEKLLRRSLPGVAPEPYVYIWLRCLGCDASPPESLGPKEWPRPLVEHLEGRIGAEELLELAATSSPGKKATRGHQREALWCLGAQAELAGDLETAASRYREVVALGHASWINWEFARARLRVLDPSD